MMTDLINEHSSRLKQDNPEHTFDVVYSGVVLEVQDLEGIAQAQLTDHSDGSSFIERIELSCMLKDIPSEKVKKGMPFILFVMTNYIDDPLTFFEVVPEDDKTPNIPIF